MTDPDRSSEIPVAQFQEEETKFEESLGADFGKASIIEEDRSSSEEPRMRSRRRMLLDTMRSISVRDHRVAALLAIALGPFGMHKFYLGYHDQGFLLLLVTLIIGTLTLGFGVIAIWFIGLIEGVNYLSFSQQDFERTYVEGTHAWF